MVTVVVVTYLLCCCNEDVRFLGRTVNANIGLNQAEQTLADNRLRWYLGRMWAGLKELIMFTYLCVVISINCSSLHYD